MDGVGTPIIERPRPIPGHDTPNPANNTYTLNYEEPDLSLVAPDPLIHVEASPRYRYVEASPRYRYKGQTLSFSGFADALASSVQMGLAVESSMASAVGVTATLRAPHDRPEMLGWVADAVARALSACGHTGGVQIRARFAHAPE
ncbi:hypothetical protein [Actinomyces bouchesdurhonensis]|uniref:hypothetical protein n=1 Tax=Actinomyces bouchesdurhonensis TaxID=1852361 RepID=UPI0036F241A8